MIDYDAPEARTMLDWAVEVPGWETMKPVEVMVAMAEAGYEMEVPPNEAVKSLKREIAKFPHAISQGKKRRISTSGLDDIPNSGKNS